MVNGSSQTPKVILLALVNDVTMLPVASDNASPSALPEIPSMPQICWLPSCDLEKPFRGALLCRPAVA